MDEAVSEPVKCEVTTIATAKPLQESVAGAAPPPTTIPSTSIPIINQILPTQSGTKLPPVDVSSRTQNGPKVPSAAAISKPVLTGKASENSTTV